YTLSRSYDDTGGIAAFPANQYDPTGEWSRSNSDSLHFFYFYGTFNAPKAVSLGASLSLRSGQPYTMTTGTDDYGTTFANARRAGVPRNSLEDRKSTRLNSSHLGISYAVFCLKKKTYSEDSLYVMTAFA